MVRKIAILMIILISFLVFGCAAQETAQVTESVPASQEPEVVEDQVLIEDEPQAVVDVQEGSVTPPLVRKISMVAKKYEFVPERITVQQGERIRLTIESVDVDHGISIPAFGINEDIARGETTTFEFVADTKGEFPMICSVFCGGGHGGMRGTLVVE